MVGPRLAPSPGSSPLNSLRMRAAALVRHWLLVGLLADRVLRVGRFCCSAENDEAPSDSGARAGRPLPGKPGRAAFH